jgi:hypothetical protein
MQKQTLDVAGRWKRLERWKRLDAGRGWTLEENVETDVAIEDEW